MDYITLLGLTAGTLTTVSMLPQAVKILKTQSASDISLGMFAMLAAGLLLWIWYGFLISSMPVVIANIVSFLLASVILSLKIKLG